MAESRSGPGRARSASRLAWLPIPMLLFAEVALAYLDIPAAFEPRLLLPALSLVFSTGVSMIIVALAARSYLRDPSRAVLLLGSGMLLYGLAGAVAAALVFMGRTNASVTVYNIGVCLAGLCELSSAMGALVPRRDRRAGRPVLILLAAPVVVVAVLAGVTYTALQGLTPGFFAETGPTLLRQVVLMAAVVAFALAGILFGLMNTQAHSSFVRWYALGLALIAVGLLGVVHVHRVGSPLGWLGRGAQYLGGFYMLWGACKTIAEGRVWELPLGILLETRERHERLVDVCPDAILVHADDRYLFANPAAARLFGARSPEDLVGRSVMELTHPDCRRIVADRIRQARVGDNPTPLRILKMLRLDGGPVDVEVTRSRVDFGGRVALQAVMRDVSDRVRAQEALRNSERRFAATFENAAVGVAQVRLDGRLLWVNGKFCEITGYTAEELTAMTFQQITFPDDLEPDLAQARRLLSGEIGSYVLEKRYLRKDGQVVWVNLTGSLQRHSDGTPDHFVAVVEDIEDRRQAQEALRQSQQELEVLNESLEERIAERTAEVQRLADRLRALATRLSRAEQHERKRVARILHDHIQQLLVAARMQVDAARRARNPERALSGLQSVDAILLEAIDASRSVTVELSPPILHQAGLIGGLQWLATSMEEKNGLSVHLRADRDAEPAAEELRLVLFECVRELLLNALKHSGVREVHVALVRTNEGRARIIVQDEGMGFDPQELRTRGPREQTFGLFSIQQRLMDFGGQMQVDAEPGRGTRVVLTVPAGQAPPVPAAQGQSAQPEEPADAAMPDSAGGKIRVLLVDDHRIMREGLAGLLRFESDIEIVGEAADGPQAVALAEELHPDVITMDVSMPGMSGLEATKVILSKVPQTRVIGLSMHLDGGVADAMRQAGAVDYLTKGGPSEDLLAAIRACRPG